MGHKCFISFKTEDFEYKKHILEELDVDMIDKSLNEKINSDDFDYIMQQIREKYLSDSTVTIFLIGEHSSELLGIDEQKYIKQELQSSLFHGVDNSKNGILGIVLPKMYDKIFTGSGVCSECGKSHTYVNISKNTVVEEFRYNYYIPNNKCAWSETDRYCVLVKWEDFKNAPNEFINQAFNKRNSEISSKTKVRF